MKNQKARTETAAMRRALAMTGVDDPCQLGGLQVLASDSMTDCRVLDPSAGKYPRPQPEIRHWSDKVEGYQRMRCKGKRKFSEKWSDDGKIKPRPYAERQKVGEHVIK